MATRKTNAAKEKDQAPAPEAVTPEAEVSADQAPAPEAVIAEVVEKFRDKETGSILETGIIIAVSAERFAELESAGVAKKLDA